MNTMIAGIQRRCHTGFMKEVQASATESGMSLVFGMAPGYRELYIRWFQFGCMLPVFRSHGTDTPREPWQFGGEDSPEYICIKETIDLRYRLLPYLYSTAEQACREGIPMIRAMLAAFPEESALHRLDDQYMQGDALLV